MNEIANKSEQLLRDGLVNLIIGYEKGTGNKRRAAFIRKTEDAARLEFDEYCHQNLAVYLLKPEVRVEGRTGIFASVYALRSLLQLASECQVKDGDIIALHVNSNGDLLIFDNFRAIEDYLATVDSGISDEEKTLLAELNAGDYHERWNYWTEEFERCIKCYACRAACPMCYCSKCTAECNQPQWVPVASHPQGVFEWHLMRAMHIAGRCVNCGECARACPAGIQLNLLTYSLIDPIYKEFGSVAGMKADAKYALSVFSPDDKESFIA